MRFEAAGDHCLSRNLKCGVKGLLLLASRFRVVIEAEIVRMKGARPTTALSLEIAVSSLKKTNAHVLVCVHKTCRKQGGKAALKELKNALKEHDLRGSVLVTKVKCLDQCGRGPVMVVYPDGVWYGGADKQSVREIVSEHLGEGRTPVGVKILRDMREAK